MSTVTLLVHGAGSCAATARLLLDPAVAPGSRAVAVPARGGIDEVIERITWAVAEEERTGARVRRVAGISLGAHAAVRWAAATGSRADLVLAMPAWTGAPGVVAAATTAAAEDVAAHGSAGVLARLGRDPHLAGDWVLEELARGWATYDDGELVSTLHAAGRSAGPTHTELEAVQGRAAVVALADDPLHPEPVAREWSAALRRARLEVVERHEPARDRGALGRAAARAWAEPALPN